MRQKPRSKRIYILTKEVEASSPREALALDKDSEVVEVRLKPIEQLEPLVGFDISGRETDEEVLWESKKKKK